MKNKYLFSLLFLFLIFLFIINKTNNYLIKKICEIIFITLFCFYDIKYGIFICIIIILLEASNYFTDNKNEGMTDINNEKKQIIPLDVYQTWHDKNLPEKMKECVENMKKNNPEFTFHLFDDNECREFIKNNFDNDVLYAFDKLVPGAYKADLWRYCILYKKGGIYLDIKFQTEPDFKLIELTDKEYFVFERPFPVFAKIEEEIELVNKENYYDLIYPHISTDFWENKEVGLYNAVMICKPNNPILLECIKDIVKNAKENNYCYNNLYVTGPGLLGKKYFNGDYSKIKDIDLFNSFNGDYIHNRKRKILYHYKEYREEQKQFSNKSYYQELWRNKQIYNN